MKSHVLQRVFVAAVVLCMVAGSAMAAVRLPAIFGDNMVLQQKTDAPIWGWADPQETVKVKGSWAETELSVQAGADGKWMVKLPTPAAGGPFSLTITASNTLTLQNVLIGVVWVCSGQSNMQWTVRNSNNSEAEIKAADYPRIRLFYVKRTVAETPQADCTGSWEICTPQTIPDFSGVAYYFGRDLFKQLDIPIGLIHTSWGGTPAESWTRKEILAADEDFQPILKRFDDAMTNYPTALEEHKKKIEEWKARVETAKAENKEAPRQPGAPMGPDSPWRPAGLYNAMIAPLIPFAIDGAIWYQGESNAGRAWQYRKLFPAMIKNWRDDWGRGDFAFYFVQIAPYTGQNPDIREAQLMTMQSVPNAGMVVTTDIGDPKDIHPRNKQDVGRRLALWALSKTYGLKDIVYSGPIYKGMKIEGDKIRVLFDYVGGGLVARNGELTHFTIAEDGKDFVPAKAVIDGDTLVVSAEAVKAPVAVRFAWENAPEPNLFNKEGLPASPFRTDTRPGPTDGQK